MNRKRFEQYSDTVTKLYPEFEGLDSIDSTRKMTRTVTFQVTDACNLQCSYCYQINKGTRVMSWKTAKRFVDFLLEADETNTYINPTISPAIVIDFIGGEPFMAIELIDKICTYFEQRCIELDHPWLTRHMFSICSNGTLYFTPAVQKFLQKFKSRLSFSVTIDGNKELHDSCRVFPDGRPSYDLAVAAAQDWMNRGGYMGSKITIAPGNIEYISEALKHMVSLGYNEINANCVYEEGWTTEHAQELYKQMKVFSDYLIDNKLYDSIYCSLYEENFFKPKEEGDDQNWCGGVGSLMLSSDPDGNLYPCIRYMESSLGEDQAPLRIGNIWDGIATTPEEQQKLKCLNCITRRTQSTDECYYCPIAEGCSWCSALNYQVFGTPDKRATFICDMHKARSLANVYFWNKVYQKEKSNRLFEMHCPKEWALPIIGEQEYNYLLKLSKED